MVDIANREQQYFAANRAYANEAEIGYVVPTEVSENYTFDIDPTDRGRAAQFHDHLYGEGGQAGDGDLTLTSEGVKTPSDKW